MADKIAVALLIYCMVREVFFVYTINKLVNKVMSRNYHEYRVANELTIPEPKTPLEEYPEDLGQLTFT